MKLMEYWIDGVMEKGARCNSVPSLHYSNTPSLHSPSS